MVCHMPVIEFSGTILDLWPSKVLGGLKWFSLEHLLEKSTSMYFHPRLLVVVGGIFGDLLGEYPSAKTHQQLLVENLMGTQVNKNFKIWHLKFHKLEGKREKQNKQVRRTQLLRALHHGVWSGRCGMEMAKPWISGSKLKWEISLDCTGVLKLVCLLAGWVDTFQK